MAILISLMKRPAPGTAREGETLLLFLLNEQKGLTNRVYQKYKVRDNLFRREERFSEANKISQAC